ncbi:hypothetical protein [Neobacillus paridis]|nr:hypothetical protein [Neobacillus paridis]
MWKKTKSKPKKNSNLTQAQMERLVRGGEDTAKRLGLKPKKRA